MTRILRSLCLGTAVAASLLLLSPSARAEFDEDSHWGGYWKWYGGAYSGYYARRPHYLYAPGRDGAPPIMTDKPFYGPGRYYGPSIAPFYAPGRVSYGNVRYGWW